MKLYIKVSEEFREKCHSISSRIVNFQIVRTLHSYNCQIVWDFYMFCLLVTIF